MKSTVDFKGTPCFQSLKQGAAAGRADQGLQMLDINGVRGSSPERLPSHSLSPHAFPFPLSSPSSFRLALNLLCSPELLSNSVVCVQLDVCATARGVCGVWA